MASRPPAPEDWLVKIADFGICAFAGSSDHLPQRDVQQAYAIAHNLILFRASLPTRPTTAMLAAGVVGGEGDTALLKSGLSDLCLDFMDFCELKMQHDQLTAADALEHPWMRLRNWGNLHHFAPIAGWHVVPEGSSDVDLDTASRYVFVKTNKTDSGEWGVVKVDDNHKLRWASLSDGRRGEGVWAAHSAVTSAPPGIWESGDASVKFSLSFFQKTGGFENVEHGDGIVRQSTHPTKPAVVISTGRQLIEYGYLTDLRPVGCFNLRDSILGVGHSPDGERLLVALDDHLRIVPCDATTGLISEVAGFGDRFSYPCHAAEVSAVAISSCKETVAVGTESGQVWLGRPTGGTWGKGHWQMIHDVSIDVPGPYISMAFSPDGDKIVAVSGTGDNTVVSVSSAGTLPRGRVTQVLPGALAAALSLGKMQVIQVYVAGWDSEGGKPWTRQFALACSVSGCGKGSDCEETRPLNRFW
ncbi:hypothetical protein IMZ48_13815 [Candidatus Bathyarchaeota archaeon]|nr:hypothetical protein [Candidatus Bathyarchaeota archaeon]